MAKPDEYIVQVASTEAELEQIFRFRYSIYCVELKRDYPGADHDKKWIRDDDDVEDYAVNLYISRKSHGTNSGGSSVNEQEVIATARLNIFQPGQVPQMYSDMFSLKSFPGWENIVTAELGRLMVSPSARGGTVFKSLIQGVKDTLERYSCQLCFLYCVPGLVKYYRRTLDAHPYNAGKFVSGGSSVGIEMVMVCNRFDISNIEHLLEGVDVPVELDEDEIWKECSAKLHLGESGTSDDDLPPILASLSEEALKMLLHSSLILKMSAEDVIAKEGTEEREVCIILDGLFEVIAHNNSNGKERLAVLEKGDVFGEIAFFSVSGRRSADVVAMTDGEVLVLNHSFLKELTVKNPEASWQILFNLGRILSERVIETSDELVSSLRKQSELENMNSSQEGETQANADKRTLLAKRASAWL